MNEIYVYLNFALWWCGFILAFASPCLLCVLLMVIILRNQNKFLKYILAFYLFCLGVSFYLAAGNMLDINTQIIFAILFKILYNPITFIILSFTINSKFIKIAFVVYFSFAWYLQFILPTI